MKRVIVVLTLLINSYSFAQYSFTGYVDAERWQNTAYLSIVEDYRKLSGVYSEQIIAKAKADSTGFFKFEGSALEPEQRIYRIHVDNCPEDDQDSNHFDGHCEDSKEIIFIARNKDTIHFPLTFDKQMFCDVTSNNPKSLTIAKVDSLKEEMRFAYTEIRSEANRRLNDKTWFKKLQDFGKELNEPLAELYIYSFLSDRSSDLHDYYLEDLESNRYYIGLQDRLASYYANTKYSKQYDSELASDQFSITNNDRSNDFEWNYILFALLALSILGNILFFISKKRKQSQETSHLKAKLTKQEQNILNCVLENKTNKEIAETMFVSLSTVKTHTNNIYRKLNVQSRDEVKDLFNK
ncbi:helix-turn-helix transcriptional regulator [Ichthyenterobacterium sp. W332]|uniref:Helix-turn-helix transcriptional regulator n=1 Tax=Microcosmobacter mediterraneus TaxID=3075607 RepID=A0ABU2YLQ8_9FLAO|nr:helix-turn-helix transcriptional regulator [Ichthyenterobacterium sp. W332]MDT0559086.1 helix-turn-helix transcriptional regulator [Ichthyenterobacterium sp. W332]